MTEYMTEEKCQVLRSTCVGKICEDFKELYAKITPKWLMIVLVTIVCALMSVFIALTIYSADEAHGAILESQKALKKTEALNQSIKTHFAVGDIQHKTVIDKLDKIEQKQEALYQIIIDKHTSK